MLKRITRSLDKSSPDPESKAPRGINSSAIKHKPRLVIAGSTETFDRAIIRRWTDEGFDVHYEHMHGDSRSSTFAVEAHGEALESGESYAVVCYHLPFPFMSLTRSTFCLIP
jgi:hypothetical protein